MTTQSDLFADASPDLQKTAELLKEVDAAAASASKTLSSGFANAIVTRKSFDATLASIAQSLAKLGAKAGAASLTQGPTSELGSLLSQSFGSSSGSLQLFADGGVVASPTFFGADGSAGLMGERGAEAIMPLARGADGQLGVKMQGEQTPLAVTVNIAAQDVDSFRRSEGQITAALARAVARGRRNL
ncbi:MULTISPECIES: phage tail tape measure protein [Methylosinus]|uniref:Phage tail protein n=1 Tax=Methylosinus trichosporium (strain ATCC 35070 / NCIMB 11131 / UNIQEM 75 / OB3b) TaxID=595536 RepID=A0A2D2CWM6_METT3|nr:MULTISPECIES: phage tail tape measure protein [Methylosinus]ATQ67147.1 phage tail protein [Methylosinus trichosporium OB3b]OBS52702.1 phage tail protein [Methylosinus sp. 3S-1]